MNHETDNSDMLIDTRYNLGLSVTVTTPFSTNTINTAHHLVV